MNSKVCDTLGCDDAKHHKQVTATYPLLKIGVTGVTCVTHFQNPFMVKLPAVTPPPEMGNTPIIQVLQRKIPVTPGNTSTTPHFTKGVTAKTQSGQEFLDFVTPVTLVTLKNRRGNFF